MSNWWETETGRVAAGRRAEAARMAEDAAAAAGELVEVLERLAERLRNLPLFVIQAPEHPPD